MFVGSGNFDPKVYAFAAGTGRRLWSFDAPSVVYSSPAVSHGVVYVGAQRGPLYALDARIGRVLSTNSLNGELVETSSPAVAQGVVFVNVGESLYAIDARSGTTLWTGAIDRGFYVSPVVANGVVYTGGNDGRLLAFAEAGCGSPKCLPLWSALAAGAMRSAPAVVNGSLYVSAGKNVHAYGLAVPDEG